MKSDRKGGEGVCGLSQMAEPVEGDGVEPTLTPEVQERLGQELRKHYASLISMPLPDRFVELLNELAKSEEDSSGQT